MRLTSGVSRPFSQTPNTASDDNRRRRPRSRSEAACCTTAVSVFQVCGPPGLDAAASRQAPSRSGASPLQILNQLVCIMPPPDQPPYRPASPLSVRPQHSPRSYPGPCVPGMSKQISDACWGKYYRRPRKGWRGRPFLFRVRRGRWCCVYIDWLTLAQMICHHALWSWALALGHPWHSSQLAQLIAQLSLDTSTSLAKQQCLLPTEASAKTSFSDTATSALPLEVLTTRHHPPSRLGPKSQGQSLFILVCFLRFILSEGGLVDVRVEGVVTRAETLRSLQIPIRSVKPRELDNTGSSAPPARTN